ncbi:hypothetical protein BS78_10G103800 [Paspalum vaginatum]|nr:hypothetical protein BS78_10G103800 [Paspalum vaginatum]
MTQVSSTSATKIYIDLDIPEAKRYQIRSIIILQAPISMPTQFNPYKYVPTIFSSMLSSYQWESPPLQQKLPQVIRLALVQAAGKLYTLEKISTMPASSFSGTSYLLHLQMPQEILVLLFSQLLLKIWLRDAFQVSQKMKIDAVEHVISLDTAIGKTKIFQIEMKVDSTSRFPMSYVIKKSFSVGNESHPKHSDKTTPPFTQHTCTNTDKNQTSDSHVKRRILFTDNEAENSKRDKEANLPTEELNLQVSKRLKQNAADKDATTTRQP